MYIHFTRDRAETVLIVLHDLPLGGSERIAIRLAQSWAALGRKVTIFCGAREGDLAWMVDDAVEVVECAPVIRRGRGSRRALGRALAAFLAQRPHDLLYVPGNYHWSVMPFVAALPDHQRPTVIAQAGTPLVRRGRGWLKQRLYNRRTRGYFQGVDAAISLSEPMTRDMDLILGRRITQCVRLPALDDEDAGVRPNPAGGRTILAVGRLVKVKGFDTALRAFARLDDPTARLVILGEGPERGALERLAADLGIADRVSLPGYVADTRPWLEAARLFLLSSRYEGYAAVLIEALAAGRPVVSTDCTPAVRRVRATPGAGAVTPVDDPSALARALHEVLNAPCPDPGRLADAVGEYRIGPIAETYLQIFDAAHLNPRGARATHRLNPLRWAAAAGRKVIPRFETA